MPSIISFRTFSAMLFLAGAGPALGQDLSSLSMRVSAEPSTELALVSVSIGGVLKELATSAPTDITLELGTGGWKYTWIVADWRGSTDFSAVPVRLAPELKGQRADLVFYKDANPLPSSTQIRKLCGEQEVKNLHHAFKMYFTCKSEALRNKTNDKTSRAAVQGWLKANFYLVRQNDAKSPFTFDSDLVDRLQEVVKSASDESDIVEWRPLRIADAQLFIKSAAERDIALYRNVPVLIKQGEFGEAKKITDFVLERYNDIEGPTGMAAVDGVNRSILDKTSADLIERIEAKRTRVDG